MASYQDGGYSYAIEPGWAGAGIRVWRWIVCDGDGGMPVAQGTSIISEEDARTAALMAIGRLRFAARSPAVR